MRSHTKLSKWLEGIFGSNSTSILYFLLIIFKKLVLQFEYKAIRLGKSNWINASTLELLKFYTLLDIVSSQKQKKDTPNTHFLLHLVGSRNNKNKLTNTTFSSFSLIKRKIIKIIPLGRWSINGKKREKKINSFYIALVNSMFGLIFFIT